MVVWVLTAGIGVYLLAVGLSAQRAGATPPVATRPAWPPVIVDPGEDGDDGETASVVGGAALTMVLGGGAPPAGRQPPVEGSPLLEFIHPALALLGLTFWICYVMSGYRAFAWIAFGVVVATIAAGLGWEAFRRRTARRRAGPADGGTQGRDSTSFPPRLIILHGFAAACTVALVVITAAVAR
jgi:hypothetical protein